MQAKLSFFFQKIKIFLAKSKLKWDILKGTIFKHSADFNIIKIKQRKKYFVFSSRDLKQICAKVLVYIWYL